MSDPSYNTTWWSGFRWGGKAVFALLLLLTLMLTLFNVSFKGNTPDPNASPKQVAAYTSLAFPEPPEPDAGQTWPPDPRVANAGVMTPVALAYHVTVGNLSQVFNQYHRNVVGDSRRVVATLADTAIGAHVAGANTGTVGVALCCGYGASYGPSPTFDLRGGVQPLARQIEDAAAVGAEMALKWKMNVNGTRPICTGQRVPVIATHYEYAGPCGYAGWRYDPGGNLAKALRAKFTWYYIKTKSGERKATWVR